MKILLRLAIVESVFLLCSDIKTVTNFMENPFKVEKAIKRIKINRVILPVLLLIFVVFYIV